MSTNDSPAGGKSEARTAGIEFGDIAAMSRRRPDGVLLESELSHPQADGPLGCALPFLIDWGHQAHPSETLAGGVRLTILEVSTPQPALLRIALDIAGAGPTVEVRQAPTAALRARIATVAC